MNKEQLWQAMGQIDEELITNTIEYEKTNGAEKRISSGVKKNFIIKRCAFAMLVVVFVGIGLGKLFMENQAKIQKQTMLAEIEKYELVKQEQNPGSIINPDYMINTVLPKNVEEAVNMSTLVVRCTVESIGQPYYEAYVSDKVKKQFIAQGMEEYSYSNIWQDCVLKVQEVYKGECSDEITYRFLSGDIEALEGTIIINDGDGEPVYLTSPKGYILEEGEEYVLFLEYNEEKNIYANSISPWYVRKKTSSGAEENTTMSASANGITQSPNVGGEEPDNTDSSNGSQSGNTGDSNDSNDQVYSELPYTDEQVKLRKEFKVFADEYYPYDDYDSDYYVEPEIDTSGIRYVIRDVEDANVYIFAQYGGAKILWYEQFENVIVYGYDFIENDIIVYGNVYGGTTELPERAWMARITTSGKILWEKIFDNGYDEDLLMLVVDDDIINVITRVEKNGLRVPSYISLMQVGGNGEVHNHIVTDVERGVSHAVMYKDSIYMATLPGYMSEEEQQIMKLDTDGSYEVVMECDTVDSVDNTNNVYEIKDMLVYNDKLYISVNETREDTVDRAAYEFYDWISNWADDGYSYFNEEALQQLRGNFTAKLLVYDVDDNSVNEVYTCDGYLTSELTIRKEQLVWNVQTIEKALYSMATSAYNVVTMNFVYEYIFDMDENLISNEKLKDAVRYSM